MQIRSLGRFAPVAGLLAAAALTTGITTGSAHAAITSISNDGILHVNPPSTIGLPNNNEANVVQGFDEVQGLTLASALGVYSLSLANDVLLPAGTTINSHMIVFDPAQSRSRTADITFSEPILGIIFRDLPLFNTHALLGRPGVSYPANNVTAYGLESTESVMLINPTTIRFSAAASSPGDRFRVLTVPTPGAVALAGLGVVVAGRRRRA